MIEGLGSRDYKAYDYINKVTSSYKAAGYQINQQVTSCIQEVMSKMEEYTYQEESKQGLEEERGSYIKEKFDLNEEDLSKLRGAGLDLEKLFYYESSTSVEARSVEGKGQNKTRLNEKIETIKKQNDHMYLYALNSKEPISINSLYESNFKGSFKKSGSGINSQDVQSVLKMNGISPNQNNAWAAQLLMTYDLPVNSESVVKLNNIKAAVDSLEGFEETKKEQEEMLLEKEAAERPIIKNGQVLYRPDQLKAFKDELGKVSEEDIKTLAEEGKEINFTNLKEAMHRNTELALKGKETLNNDKQETGSELTEQIVEETKLQIEQIRAKLTTEAASRISEKMPLESTKLSKLAQEILTTVEEMAGEACELVGIPPTTEHKAIIEESMLVKEAMSEHPLVTIGTQLKEGAISLQAMHGVLNAYEENASVAEARFGEGMGKVADQISGVLENQGIEINEDTIKAAKALILNGVEITPETMAEAIEVTMKIDTFLETFTPVQAAQLIKEGLNPYTASVDGILAWMSKENLEGLKGSVAETIVALEEKGQLSSEQKETMLGLYRILQGVTNHKEEVMGYLYKNELPLTIEKLQEATKYIKKEKPIDVRIDDHFGEVTNSHKVETAKGLIEENRQQMMKAAEVVEQIEQLVLPLEEGQSLALQKINAFLYPLIKEQFKTELGKFEGMSTLPKRFLEKLEYVKNVEAEVIESMIEKEIPLTVSNIYWVDKLEKNPSLYGELLANEKMLEGELPEDLEALDEILHKIEEQAKESKEIATFTSDLLSYRQNKELSEIVTVQRELMEKEGIYHIPFMINGEQKLIELYINKEHSKKRAASNELKAVISYETSNLGKVTAFLEIKEDQISYSVKGENAQASEKLRAHEDFLSVLIEEIGYKIIQSEYTQEVNEEALEKDVKNVKKGNSLFEEIV